MSRAGNTVGAPRATGPGAAAAAAATVLGVDIGGTKLRAALAGPDGTVLAELVEPTDRGSGEEIVAQVAAALATLRARAGVAAETVRAAGIGLPLAVDPRTGTSWSFHNVPGLGRIDASAAFRDALGVPVALENDANCAALGEGRSGAAVGASDFVVVAIGTGIGGGIVAGGRLVRGAHGGAGEIAFLPLGTDPWDERNRARGAYETAVAGPAIRARLDAALRAGTAADGARARGHAGRRRRRGSRRRPSRGPAARRGGAHSSRSASPPSRRSSTRSSSSCPAASARWAASWIRSGRALRRSPPGRPGS